MVHDWNQQHSLSSGLLSTLELCSAGKFAVPYSRSFRKITQCGDIKLTVGPHQAVTSGIHTGQVLGVKHPEVPWGLENRVTFWGTLLWQNFQHSQVSEAAAAQSGGRCCDLLLVLENLFAGQRLFLQKVGEGRTHCCAFLPASASPLAMCDGPQEENYCSLSPLPPKEGCGTTLSIAAHSSSTNGSRWWQSLPKINKSVFYLLYLQVFG